MNIFIYSGVCVIVCVCVNGVSCFIHRGNCSPMLDEGVLMSTAGGMKLMKTPRSPRKT